MNKRSRRRRSSRTYRKLRGLKLFRVFQKDRPFLVVFCVGFLAALAVAVAVPKVWSTAPSTYQGRPIRVSLVDLAQARSLRSGAQAAEAAGRWDDAVSSWHAALANNRGDDRLHRGLLRCLLVRSNAPLELAPLVLDEAAWLLSLSGTNRADAVLASDTMVRFGRTGPALALWARIGDGGDDAAAQARARALFSAGLLGEFDRMWRSNAVAWGSSPGLAPYRDAFLMATDPGSAGIEAGQRLKTALELPGADGLLAARLLHAAAVRRGLAVELAAALKRLEAGSAASVAHRVPLWRLMAASGRIEEARADARRVREVPVAADDAARYVEGLAELGLKAEAKQFLDANLGLYGTAHEIWKAAFEFQVAQGDWNEVRRLGANARVSASRTDALLGEALFAEYRAAQAQNRTRDALESIRQLTDLTWIEPELSLRVSARWRADGRPEPALLVLRGQEARAGVLPAYWMERFQVGYALRDLGILREAVDQGLRLEPANPAWQNARAAVLLLAGEAPSEALQLTFDGLQRHPASVVHQINHAIALSMNRRIPEAAQILDRIPAETLDAEAAPSYHLALAEVRLAEGRPTEAAAAASRVDRGRLFPAQRERLDRVLGRPAAVGGG